MFVFATGLVIIFTAATLLLTTLLFWENLLLLFLFCRWRDEHLCVCPIVQDGRHITRLPSETLSTCGSISWRFLAH
jgi:hypothetical protein